MGDRVSISFVNTDLQMFQRESVTLFNHWGGTNFVEEARAYVKDLFHEVGDNTCSPIDRLEPNTVMVDFIRHITKDEERITGNLYLGKDSNEGDNSDNGHYQIELSRSKVNKLVNGMYGKKKKGGQR